MVAVASLKQVDWREAGLISEQSITGLLETGWPDIRTKHNRSTGDRLA